MDKHIDLIKPNGKRFYGNAGVIITENTISLRSYNTIVCQIVNGEFHRTWYGWSASTARHIRFFLAYYATSALSAMRQKAREDGTTQKAVWLSMPVHEITF